MTAKLLHGDALDVLATLPAGSVQACITSPPYYGLRDYGVDGQIGLEKTPQEYVERLVAVFREVRRVLADDGTLWLNLGDSYAGSWGARGRGDTTNAPRPDLEDKYGTAAPNRHGYAPWGVKPKDLMGIPWRVAFALQADGWYLRADIIWHKPNPMPESVRDRPTKAHEYLFLLSKSERYFYNADAIAEPVTCGDHPRTVFDNTPPTPPGMPPHKGLRHWGAKRSGNRARKYGDDRDRPGSQLGASIPWEGSTRNKRSVWTVTTKPYPEAHFATYPPDLIRPCVLAGTRPGDTILDPFNGSGTTGQVALEHGRDYIGIDLNAEYLELARRRLAPLLAQPRLLEAV